MSGMISGAQQGASAGSSFGPAGSLFGGIAGGLMGLGTSLFGNSEANRRYGQLADLYSTQARQVGENQGANQADLTQLYGRNAGGYTNKNLEAQRRLAERGEELGNGVSAADVQAQLDPTMQYQMDQAANALTGQFGSKGSLFSGAAGNSIAQGVSNVAKTGYNDAWARALSNLQNMQGQNAATAGQYGALFGADAQGVGAGIENRTAGLEATQELDRLAQGAKTAKKSGGEMALDALFG